MWLTLCYETAVGAVFHLLVDNSFSRTNSEQLEECFKKPGEVFVLDIMG